MRWLVGRWRLAALFGAVGGPGAYYAGAQLGAVSFPEPVAALAALAVGWSILTPLVCWIALELGQDEDRPSDSSCDLDRGARLPRYAE
jgi:hypothetical protein